MKGYSKEEKYNQESTDSLKENYAGVLKTIGEDVNREGLLKTPERVSKSMEFLTNGYKKIHLKF